MLDRLPSLFRPLFLVLLIAAARVPLHGADQPFDFKNAVALASMGDTEALYSVGRAYLKGEGAPEDPAKAVEFFKKAAEKGHAKAQANLGALLVNGKGTAVDLPAARDWFQKAAAQGDPVAQTNLGWLYYAGLGVEKNIPEGLRWYRLAAETGQTDAQMRLVDHCIKPPNGFEPNNEEAVKWLKLAAAKEIPAAENSLAVFYEQGLVVKENMDEALRLYRKAAEHNEPRAQMNLGRLYDEGRGVPRDAVQSAFWLTLSADQKEFAALKMLQDMQVRGRITQKEILDGRKMAEEFRAKLKK